MDIMWISQEIVCSIHQTNVLCETSIFLSINTSSHHPYLGIRGVFKSLISCPLPFWQGLADTQDRFRHIMKFQEINALI